MVTDKTGAGDTEETTSPYMLLFELEGAAVDGRAKLYAAASRVFKSAGITLSEREFSRHCVHAAPPYVIEKLLAECGQGKLNEDAAERIMADYTQRIHKDAPSLHPVFQSVLEEAGRRGIRATAISVLPEETARAVLTRSGIDQDNIDLQLFPENERHFPRTDCWLKVPRSQGKSPRRCIAVAGCRDSGKSALSSGMRCIVVTDQYTSYQDFSGVDAVLDDGDSYSLPELFDDLT